MTPNPGWSNRGGDKLFVGPHDSWRAFAKSIWPPQASWDAQPHQAEILPEGGLRTTSPTWEGFGVRLIREYAFNLSGAFVIQETIEKVSGEPRLLAFWSISQAVPPDATFMATNPTGPYKWGYLPFSTVEPIPSAELVSPDLLRAKPKQGAHYKIGLDRIIELLAAQTNCSLAS